MSKYDPRVELVADEIKAGTLGPPRLTEENMWSWSRDLARRILAIADQHAKPQQRRTWEDAYD